MCKKSSNFVLVLSVLDDAIIVKSRHVIVIVVIHICIIIKMPRECIGS